MDATHHPVQRDMFPTRQTLLSRLKDWSDEDSWRDFFDTYWKLIYTTAVKAGLADAEAQEVVQETVLSVCKNMRDFRYDPKVGSFKGWLLLITRRRIADQFRQRGGLPEPAAREEDPDATSLLERLPDESVPNLDRIWDQEWTQNLMEIAIERVKRRADPKAYQIFDLTVLKEWPVAKVSQSLQVGTARIYLARHRIAAMIKKEIKILESRTL